MSLVCFKLIFENDVKKGPRVILLNVDMQVPQHHLFQEKFLIQSLVDQLLLFGLMLFVSYLRNLCLSQGHTGFRLCLFL